MTLFLNATLFRAIIGISIKEFKILHSNIVTALVETCIETGDKKTYVNKGRKRCMSTHIQLLAFLLYMRQYISYNFLSWLLDIHPGTIYKYNQVTMNVLFDYYKTKIKLPDLASRMRNGRKLCGAIITAVVDGAEQGVLRPLDKVLDTLIYSGNKKFSKLYSKRRTGKKAKHTFSVMVVCAPTGFIYYISPSYNGSMNDKSIIDLDENKFHRHLTRFEWIAADLGYKGLQHEYERTALPFPDNKEKGYHLTDDEKMFNKRFKSIRTVVENVISHIKNWKICKSTFRAHTNNLEQAQAEHNKIWTIAAGLTNESVMPLKVLDDTILQ